MNIILGLVIKMKRKICRIIINIFSLEKENTNLIKNARVYLLVGRKRAYLGKTNKLGEARITLIMGRALDCLLRQRALQTQFYIFHLSHLLGGKS